jgi:hypothetical protein
MRRIKESKVKDALKMMKEGKVMGSDGIPIEVWRSFGDVAILWRNILVPIFKNKGMCKVVLITGGSNQ